MTLKVNGEIVPDEEIAGARQQLAREMAANGVADPDAYVKRAVVDRVLVKQEAARRYASLPRHEIDAEMERVIQDWGGPEAFTSRLEQLKIQRADIEAEVKLRLQVDRLLDEACKGVETPTEEDVCAHYGAHPEDFMLPETVHAAHIVRHAQGTVIEMHEAAEAMRGVLAQIEGGTPFETLARQYSDCPDDGGDLGYFPRGAMVKEFEDVVFNLQPGEMSGIFQTPFGVHIAKVYDHRPAEPRAFEEVKEQVRETLRNERENAAIDAYTATLRVNAVLEDEGA